MKEKKEENLPEQDKNIIKLSVSYTQIIVVSILVFALGIFCFKNILGFYIVSGSSMVPHYYSGQIVKTEKIEDYNTLEYGDVVIVKADKKKLIKRIVGLPGDIVEIQDHNLYVNGKRMPYYQGIETADRLWVIETDQYFVVGDNFNNSNDSRTFGSLPSKQILLHVTTT